MDQNAESRANQVVPNTSAVHDCKLMNTLSPSLARLNWCSIRVLFAVWLAHVTAFGIVYSFGMLLPALLEEWPYSSAGELGLLGSALTGSFFGISIIVGKAVMRFGHRRAALFGACLVPVGWVIVFFAQQPYQAYPGVALLGFGFSFVWSAGVALLPLHFPTNKATASGFAVTGSGFGSLLWSWITSALLEKMGLRYTILILSALNGGCAFLTAAGYAPAPQFYVSSPLNAKGVQSDVCASGPNSQTLGKSDDDVERLDDEESTCAAELPSDVSAHTRRVIPLSRDPVYYALCVTTFSSCLGFLAPFTHVAAYSTEIGCDDSIATQAYMVFGILSIVGRLLAGPLGDHFGALVVWAAGMPLCAGALLWLGSVTGCSQIIGSLGVFGLFSGPIVALMAPLLIDLFGLERLPMALGPMATYNGLASMLAPGIAGLARDMSGSYTVSFILASAFMLNAGGIMVLVHALHLRRPEKTQSAQSKHASKP